MAKGHNQATELALSLPAPQAQCEASPKAGDRESLWRITFLVVYFYIKPQPLCWIQLCVSNFPFVPGTTVWEPAWHCGSDGAGSPWR